MEDFINNIDWDLLRKQKASLIELCDKIDSVNTLEHVEGIINLINKLQDIAVDKLGIDEDVVFELTEE